MLHSIPGFPGESSANCALNLYMVLKTEGAGDSGCPIGVTSGKHLITGLWSFR